MIVLSGILIGLPLLGHKYSFAPSLASLCDMHRKALLLYSAAAAQEMEGASNRTDHGKRREK